MKEIKKCDTSMSVAKDQYQTYSYHGNNYNQHFVRNRARGRGGPVRGYSTYSRGYRYQFQGPRKPRKPATVTSAGAEDAA